LLFLDEQGAVVQRKVGYIAPERFAATLGEAKRP
jgi:hypothetical protein